MRILGIDPGLQKTGWGIIESEGHALRFVACGLIKSNPSDTLPECLRQIDSELTYVVEQFRPDLEKIARTIATVRVRLSVSDSTMNATPPGP